METDVVVIGGGIAGLVAAREAARAGARVLVLEAAGVPGGLVGAHTVGPLVLDTGAESFATRGGTVAELLEQLGLGSDVVTPARVPARVHIDGVSLPMPATGVLGVPTDFGAPGLAAVLGSGGLDRARQDLDLAAEVGTAEPTLAGLVQARMGAAVLDRLLRPVVRGVHSVEPEELGAEDLLPGLRSRLAEHGCLAAALASFRAAAPAGSAVQGIEGGMYRLVSALVTDLREAGVELRTASPCLRARSGQGGWVLDVGDGQRTSTGGGRSPGGGRGGGQVRCRRLLLACAPHTWTFLEPASGPAGCLALAEQGAQWPAPAGVDLITLILDEKALGEHERAGVLVAYPGQGAKALTYASAKWGWLGQQAGADLAVLRLSYAGEVTANAAPATSTGPAGSPASSDQVEQARQDVSRLLGIDIGVHAIRHHGFQHHTLPRPVLATGMAEQVRQMRESVAATGHLDVAGTWIAGTGLASVIPDAMAAGERLAAI